MEKQRVKKRVAAPKLYVVPISLSLSLSLSLVVVFDIESMLASYVRTYKHSRKKAKHSLSEMDGPFVRIKAL